jgi:hypothetical protein
MSERWWRTERARSLTRGATLIAGAPTESAAWDSVAIGVGLVCAVVRSHVRNGAVNGNALRTMRHVATNFASMGISVESLRRLMLRLPLTDLFIRQAGQGSTGYLTRIDRYDARELGPGSYPWITYSG